MPSFHPTQKLVFEKQSVIYKFQLIAEHCQFFFLPLHHHPFLLTTTKKASAVLLGVRKTVKQAKGVTKEVTPFFM